MARGSIKKNYILNVSNQLMNILAPLITTPYTSRVLTTEGVGEYSYSESITSYFVLFAILGTATYAQREISYVQDNENERSRVFYNTLALRLLTTALMLAVYLVVLHDKILFVILAINILNVACDVTWFFQGMEEFGKIAGRNVVFKLISIIYTFAVVKTEKDLLLYAIGMVGLNLLGNVSLWRHVGGYVTRPKLSAIRPFENVYAILSLFVPTIAIQIYTIFDKTMLGLFTETSYENGCYEQAMKVVRALQIIVCAIGTVMAPRIGYYFAKDDREKVREYMLKAYRFVWFVGIPMAFGLIGVSDNMVPWFFGNGYDKVKILLKILPVLAVVIGMSNVTGIQYLIPTKRQNILTGTVASGAAVNFCLNLILIPSFFSVGAAMASVAAETVITALQLWYVRNEIDLKSIFRSGQKYILAGVLMLGTLRMMSRCLSGTLFHTVCMIVTGTAVYVGALLLTRDEYFLENCRMVADRLRRIWKR